MNEKLLEEQDQSDPGEPAAESEAAAAADGHPQGKGVNDSNDDDPTRDDAAEPRDPEASKPAENSQDEVICTPDSNAATDDANDVKTKVDEGISQPDSTMEDDNVDNEYTGSKKEGNESGTLKKDDKGEIEKVNEENASPGKDIKDTGNDENHDAEKVDGTQQEGHKSPTPDSIQKDGDVVNENEGNKSSKDASEATEVVRDKPASSHGDNRDRANATPTSSMKSSLSKKSKTVRVRSSKTVSTAIDIDMSHMMDDVDSDDDDAGTRITACCGKSVDFSMPVMDEVEAELQRVINRPGSGRTSMMDDEMLGVGRAATMNTPVTNNDDRESFIYTRSIRTPSRDGIYQHALNLINNRCQSHAYSVRSQPQPRRRKRVEPPPRSAASLPSSLLAGVPVFRLPNVVEHINAPPFMDQPNSFFYVEQQRPLPMRPMKVWKGYQGNVYFEPMVCRSAPLNLPPTYDLSSPDHRQSSKSSSRFPSISSHSADSRSRLRQLNGDDAESSVQFSFQSETPRTATRSGRRGGTKSAMSSRSGAQSQRQLAILDKYTVLGKMDYNAAEDLKWISGIESTGTLQIGPEGQRLTGYGYKVYRDGDRHPKLRIRRGLVSHNLAGSSKNSPALGVSGGRINEDQATNQQTRVHQTKTSTQDISRSGNQSFPHEKYQCVDSATALQQIRKRNDGHGRSKLVHILPSAYSDNPAPMRAKGK
ncbi:uncharacterized protein [Diadema setosum]|uniref:uncharacterized protein n=1 Tax=Diadema setosum TaxID=31175 RepID=UPI003B3A4D06